MIRIIKGDVVKVISGKNKSTVRKVVDIKKIQNDFFVFLEDINITRCMKKGRNGPGKRITKGLPIHISNVVYFNRKLDLSSKIGYKIEENRKIRFMKKNKVIINEN